MLKVGMTIIGFWTDARLNATASGSGRVPSGR